MKSYFVALIAPFILLASGCTGTDTIQTSGNTAIIQTRAAPICGSSGAVRTAEKQAAIATLKAGFDRFIIVSAASADTVRVIPTIGSSTTIGTINGGYVGGGMYSGTYKGTTTYQPGMPIVRGDHRQSFGIHMFHDGEPGSQNALAARSILGPKWRDAMKEGSLGTCIGS